MLVDGNKKAAKENKFFAAFLFVVSRLVASKHYSVACGNYIII
jgi:hypothetical protein